MSQSSIRWEKDADNIVILTMDDPNQSANTMNALYQKSMGETVDRLVAEKADIAGVILTSAKRLFRRRRFTPADSSHARRCA